MKETNIAQEKEIICDCGAIVEKILSCKHCEQEICDTCGILDDGIDEWFCNEECQIAYLQNRDYEQSQIIAGYKKHVSFLESKAKEAEGIVEKAWDEREGSIPLKVSIAVGTVCGLLTTIQDKDDFFKKSNGI